MYWVVCLTMIQYPRLVKRTRKKKIPRKQNKRYLRAFGKHLRVIRRQAKFSQEALGLDAELTKNHIGMIERGEVNITLNTIKRIADILGVKPHVLLDF